ncbi:response regulator transcription factor [Microbacterium telephonicum]|uniref:DNA-binding response OmpR family regulator n=1 Tax=Microbacterium telephonicum TaxID=1714841 RepID=A0A498C3T3_9MICO|nr:response regulator transcription factor [Microbacterium telephonicum]RLK49617.1 DNA-binding response OmpR family regulator [Microbacterium telephonicum]
MAPTAVVVEDESDISGLITTVLESCGYEVHAAADGLSAVELIRRVEPQLTTLDVNIPGIDGLEVARRIRAFSDTYIIFISAFVEPGDAERARAAGGDEYLGKPFRPRDLRARVTALPAQGRVPVEASGSTSVAFADVEVDAYGARIAGVPVRPDPAETAVLRALVRAPGRRVPKTDLALLLRGDRSRESEPGTDELLAVEKAVGSLRARLDAAGSTATIESVLGASYRLVPR